MELPVTLQYELTDKNFADLMSAGHRRAFGKTRLFLGYTLPFVAATCVGAVASYTQEFDLEVGLAFGFLAYAIGWIISHQAFYVSSEQLTHADSLLTGIQQAHITEETVEVTTAKSLWRMNWEGILDVREEEHSIILFIDRMQAIVINTNVFTSDKEKATFIQICCDQVLKSRRPK